MDAFSKLVDALLCLPGIGPKSARRMVYHLLQQKRARGMHLAACLQDAMQTVQACVRCNNYTEATYCQLCSDTTRDISTLCVVEMPADMLAIEESHAFKGRYFVLMGKISPLDGIGPQEIHLPHLQKIVMEEQPKELILALSSSVEGLTTIHFIRELFKDTPLTITQLAQGIPSSAELEYLDGYTIRTALQNRAFLQP